MNNKTCYAKNVPDFKNLRLEADLAISANDRNYYNGKTPSF